MTTRDNEISPEVQKMVDEMREFETCIKNGEIVLTDAEKKSMQRMLDKAEKKLERCVG